MRLSDAGYCRGQYDPIALRKYAEDAAWACHEIMKRLDVDTIAVTGKSGMSVVFAAQMIDPFNFMVVRKETDMSHGRPLEGREGHFVRRYAILDDFVASGQTIRAVAKAVYGAELVAVIEYTKPPRDFEGDVWIDEDFTRSVPVVSCAGTATKAKLRSRFVDLIAHSPSGRCASGTLPDRIIVDDKPVYPTYSPRNLSYEYLTQ